MRYEKKSSELDLFLLIQRTDLLLKRNNLRNMYLFIDTLSDPTYIALFDEHRKIIGARTWPGKQKEFDTLTEEIDSLLQKHTLSYRSIIGIVVII